MADTSQSTPGAAMPPYIPFHEQTLPQLRAELAHWLTQRPGTTGRERYMRVCREWIERRERERANG